MKVFLQINDKIFNDILSAFDKGFIHLFDALLFFECLELFPVVGSSCTQLLKFKGIKMKLKIKIQLLSYTSLIQVLK